MLILIEYIISSIALAFICCWSAPQPCLTHCDPMDCSMPGFPFLHSSPRVCSNSCLLSDDAIQPSHSLLSHSPALIPSQNQGLFQRVSSSIRWSFSFSISPSNKYSALISFRIDWFDLLTVQGILKCLLQHHTLKASSLQCSAFFMVQLSLVYMTTGKTIALTTWSFVRKVMSLLFNTLSRFVIAFSQYIYNR